MQTERFGESRKDKADQTMARDPDDSSAIDANDKSAQGDSKTAIGTKKTRADKKTAHDKANRLAKGK
ncbi:hypothetical protein BC940DRAFT_292332 [Gongronella butleri]|nr:hypothetical protein BC940DRAFT_292332 [Gongronella butleri]